ncbi:MAG TPA: DNA methyltransferase [Ktedonobacteraceae bacterium]|jgi:site-specific DNA-methyltransferase (adenine-specific)/adenine-specific DNA-methyltransferase
MAQLQWQGKELASIPGANLRDTQTRLHTSETHTATLPPSPEQASWHNRLIHGERTAVLALLLPEFSARVNLIYIDPPFMTGRDFKHGERLAYSDKWQGNLDAYLQWLATTLSLLYTLLAPDGSLYVHLDWRVSHYARVILDEIFGPSLAGRRAGFQNEIIWHYQSGGRATRRYARKHDTILFYTKSAQYCFHGERIGKRRGAHKRNHMRKQRDEQGRVSWSIHSHGRLYTYSEESVMTPSDVWSDISHLHQRDPERNGYATQKPGALLERILLASSEPEHLVLDCFCGSGVTPWVAERLGRRWIASDLSELAISATRARLLALSERTSFVVQRCQSPDAAEA